MKIFPALFLVLILSGTILKAQTAAPSSIGSKPFILGITDKIYSKELSENRTLNIYLPEGYDTSSRNYPVIYLLDGSSNEDFIHIVGIVQFLNMINVLPNTIVVGIANVDRKRDFTFPSKVPEDVKLVPTSGGSAKFMSFIEKELQPYIQSHYRVGAQRTLIGQSLGGLLATEILLRKPSLFNNYIIISPSLWWDHESLLTEAPALLKACVDNDIKIYISVGDEGKDMIMPAVTLTRLINTACKDKSPATFVPLPEETHLTILHRSVYNALEYLYKK